MVSNETHLPLSAGAGNKTLICATWSSKQQAWGRDVVSKLERKRDGHLARQKAEPYSAWLPVRFPGPESCHAPENVDLQYLCPGSQVEAICFSCQAFLVPKFLFLPLLQVFCCLSECHLAWQFQWKCKLPAKNTKTLLLFRPIPEIFQLSKCIFTVCFYLAHGSGVATGLHMELSISLLRRAISSHLECFLLQDHKTLHQKSLKKPNEESTSEVFSLEDGMQKHDTLPAKK